MTRAAFDAADAEMLVTIEAIDETFAQQVQSRTSYKAREVVWGAHFADMFVRRTGRPLGVDVCRLSEFSPADLPAASEPPVAT
jgi:inward rectifier potassium channel